MSESALQLVGLNVVRESKSGAAVSVGHRDDECVPIDELVPILAGEEPIPGSEPAQAAAVTQFLASEHMHALGVPTTRAASVVVSHETTVIRDMFYDGNPKQEPTAMVMRIAQSFLRFGSFEIFKDTDPRSARRGPSAGLENRAEMMRQMLDFSIQHYFPATHDAKVDEAERKYVLLFEEVAQRTARLVAKWQSIGFCHGVLNTDNMSLVGDTLDYGPFGFMEHFNPEHVCNTSDDGGRYRYEAQPEICKWNLSVLADQLALVVDRVELEPALDAFNGVFEQELSRLMCAKLGLVHKSFPSEDRTLVDALFDVFTETGADFTCVFRALAGVKPFDERSIWYVADELAEHHRKVRKVWTTWLREYVQRLRRGNGELLHLEHVFDLLTRPFDTSTVRDADRVYALP
ncbi:hypothetical protein PybrP1_006460, partial [[Pythium] brassicae (nom. inval.)]